MLVPRHASVKKWFVAYIVALVWLQQSEADDSSSAECFGIWSNCTTLDTGALHCQMRPAVNPFAPTVCHFSNACLEGNTLDLYSDSDLVRGFEGASVSLSQYAGQDIASGESLRVRVHPAAASVEGWVGNSINISKGGPPAVLVRPTRGGMNIGHVYGDELWPAFQMLLRHSFYDSSETGLSDYQRNVHLVLSTFTNNMDEKHYYDTILKAKHRGNRAVTEVRGMLASETHIYSEGRACFPELYVGSNTLSYSFGLPSSSDLMRFRRFLFSRYKQIGGIQDAASLVTEDFYSLRDEPVVLFAKKVVHKSDHAVHLDNVDEAVEALRSAMPHIKLKSVSWAGMSQQEQIKMMLGVDVFVTIPGGDAMNALFLPVGSTLLTPCRKVDYTWVNGKLNKEKLLIEYGNEVRIWFNQMEGLRNMQLCGANDIVYTSGPRSINGHLNITTFTQNIKTAVDDWKHRRFLRLNAHKKAK